MEDWIQEVRESGIGDEAWDNFLDAAWEDIHGGSLPADKVREARMEEVEFMQDKGIWTLRPVQ